MFYLLAAAAVATWVYGIARRVRLWRQGRPARRRHRLAARTSAGSCATCCLQRRVWGRGLASVAHVLLFSGFVVLLIGTTLIAIEHVLADLLGASRTTPCSTRASISASTNS